MLEKLLIIGCNRAVDEVCFVCSPGQADHCPHRDTFIAKIKAGSGV